MNEQELVIGLAGKLVAFGELDGDAAYEIAPVLLGVIEEYARERAAAELEMAAAGLAFAPAEKAKWLRERAAKLRQRVFPCSPCRSDGVGHRDDCPRFPAPFGGLA